MARMTTFWSKLVPILGVLVLAAAIVLPMNALVASICLLTLTGAVICAVHHAEVVAHRVGEPFGTLVLALAVTIIEVALIVSIMLSGDPAETAVVPRDTVFSAIMIICNGLIGLCLLIGGIRYREQSFNTGGANAALATLIALTTLSLILPAFTTTSAGPTYSASQLSFAAIASLVLWGTFVFVQTVRHRDYFLPVADRGNENIHATPPTNREAWVSFGFLNLGLVVVVGLAKMLSPSIEAAVAAVGAPQATIGVLIAVLVLLPETTAAIRAARANRLQTSLNLALGSALASIGLTIPAVALTSLLLGTPLQLGLQAKDLVLLTLTFLVTSITLVTGRTSVMQGAIHVVIFAAFLFLTLIP
jgi:Ca2+:H+ antiporter